MFYYNTENIFLIKTYLSRDIMETQNPVKILKIISMYCIHSYEIP